jgi:hypothetical protein
MRDAGFRRRTVNISLAVLAAWLVILGALLATIVTARTMHIPGREVPQTCPQPARYAAVGVVSGGATHRNADYLADGASCTRPSAPTPPMPTPSNDLIDDRGCP